MYTFLSKDQGLTKLNRFLETYLSRRTNKEMI
jgi:hypothetical protein